MSHNIDLEAQSEDSELQVLAVLEEEAERSEIYGGRTSNLPSETKSGAIPVSINQQVKVKAPPAISQTAEGVEDQIREKDVHYSQRDDEDAATCAPVKAEPQSRRPSATPVVGHQIAPPSPRIDVADQDMRMIGDFDGSANALWTLYRNEAKSYDEAHIQTLKDDMDGVLIFRKKCAAR